ncbi:endonuclease 8-like 2 isoform X2 [Oryctolagus cuniculus]|uniref:endonuclease 8-like 2 isoform X2 n=1 Tax=Oryctolagus cuniculus TaxID=9986 RepID=UPI00048F70C6
MPEGPSVRKFHHLVSPFVGQQVVKTGGSSKKLHPPDLQSLWLQDTQVHGKKLFLRFDPDEELRLRGNDPLPEPLRKGAQEVEAADQEQAVGPSRQTASDKSSQAAALAVPPGDEGPKCLGADCLTPGAERWLQVSFGLFGSIWVNEFSRAKKANKRGDWRDPAPREHHQERSPLQSRGPSALPRLAPESFVSGGPCGPRGGVQYTLAAGQAAGPTAAPPDLPEGAVSCRAPGPEAGAWAPGRVSEADLVVPAVPAPAPSRGARAAPARLVTWPFLWGPCVVPREERDVSFLDGRLTRGVSKEALSQG